MSIKTRFCPSPTGFMHLGNARTALFSALAVKVHDTFLLRIEDTDIERSEERYTEALKEDLQWLGCQWNEGPGCEIPGHGPYEQSQRLSIYQQYYDELQQKGMAYPCYCTPEELDASRKRQSRMGKPPRYAGTCKHLTQAPEDRAPTLRFAMPENKVIEFDDIVRGHQCFQADDIGDFIIRKADGMATFMFCNAIDDSLMGVTLALRGEDHLTNTPRQLIILEALGLPAPQYGHISLILGEDGTPLSKRNGSRSIRELREQGYLPLAIVNYLARLGHVYTDHNHLMSFTDCSQYFSLTHLVKAPARYDQHQLNHWQKEVVLALSMDEYHDWVKNADLSLVPHDKKESFLSTIRPNVLFSGDVNMWAEHLFSSTSKLTEENKTILKEAGDAFLVAAIHALHTVATYQELCAALKEKLGVSGKKLFMPLRVAMSQQMHGPELAALFDLLGKEKLIQRFEELRTVL